MEIQMEPIEYERMYQAENHHWWYLGMEAITRAVLDHYLYPVANRKILDAGCGTGAAMSTYLADYGNVTGFDLSSLALRSCQSRKLTLLTRASVTEIPYQSSIFDLVTSFDVLYIVTKDSVAMDEYYRVLRPGGFLLLRLPAYDWLRGQHDITVYTTRRYTVPKVNRMLENSGFRTVRLTYANTFLFPVAVAKRLLERIWPPEQDSSDLSFPVGAFNGLFKRILSFEAPLATRIVLPFGLSVFALGQKPNDSD
jgi:SAM-dependent methyltransferase